MNVSEVYWNPRLSTEHERIVTRLKHGSIVYDVFAGIGPFAVPAGKRKCTVLANDLNPDAYKWLLHNIALNKMQQWVTAYNIDGRDFLLNVVRQDLAARWRNAVHNNTVANIHIIMNLPAQAPDFLEIFVGMFSFSKEFSTIPITCSLPWVHCYCYTPTTNREAVVNLMLNKLHGRLDSDQVDVIHVRSVSPNKEMMRASFRLSRSLLFEPSDILLKEEEPPTKILRLARD
jgi:tRNA (guanine37-N1)-methyltransferase